MIIPAKEVADDEVHFELDLAAKPMMEFVLNPTAIKGVP